MFKIFQHTVCWNRTANHLGNQYLIIGINESGEKENITTSHEILCCSLCCFCMCHRLILLYPGLLLLIWSVAVRNTDSLSFLFVQRCWQQGGGLVISIIPKLKPSNQTSKSTPFHFKNGDGLRVQLHAPDKHFWEQEQDQMQSRTQLWTNFISWLWAKQEHVTVLYHAI